MIGTAITIPADVSSLSVPVAAINDHLAKAPLNVDLTLASGAAATCDVRTATTISDPTVTVAQGAAATVAMTVTGDFTNVDPVTLDSALATIATSNYTLFSGGGGESFTATVTGGDLPGRVPIAATDVCGNSAAGTPTVTIPFPALQDTRVGAADNGPHEIDLTITSDPSADGMVIDCDGQQVYAGPSISEFQSTGLSSGSQYTYTVTVGKFWNDGQTTGDLTSQGQVTFDTLPDLISLTANTATAQVNDSADLEIDADGNGDATLNLSALYMMGQDGEGVTWSVSGANASPSGGTFADPAPIVQLTGLTASSAITITAAACNGAAVINGNVKAVPQLSVVNESVTFDNSQGVLRDDGTGAYASPDWAGTTANGLNANNQDAARPTEGFPVSYQCSSSLGTSVSFQLAAGNANIPQGSFYIDGYGNGPNDMYLDGAGTLAGNTLTADLTPGSILPDTITNWDLSITWTITFTPSDGGSVQTVSAPTSMNHLYVTGGAASNAYETVLDVGCRGANGTAPSATADVISGIWGQVQGHTLTNSAGKPMTYWGQAPKEPKFISTADLVKNKDGKCEAWADFLYDVLRAQGIASTMEGLTPKYTCSGGCPSGHSRGTHD
ncbi:MAG TPA: hypothetical protein VG326_16115 [Tepidisphaeraceae bacterium]|jgi:hypothetical protein|nr:hypothetical protein [Tepidisphaeraceae bacterium]